MPILPEEEGFDRRWLHESTQEHQMAVVANLNAVKEFAYHSFDALDKDGNGFLTRHELLATLQHAELNNREKSFVMFLLNNHPQIASMNEEHQPEEVSGISRNDIELYFELLANLL